MILESEQVEKLIKNNKYLSCPYCKRKDLKISGKYDSLIRCYINSEKRK